MFAHLDSSTAAADNRMGMIGPSGQPKKISWKQSFDVIQSIDNFTSRLESRSRNQRRLQRETLRYWLEIASS